MKSWLFFKLKDIWFIRDDVRIWIKFLLKKFVFFIFENVSEIIKYIEIDIFIMNYLIVFFLIWLNKNFIFLYMLLELAKIWECVIMRDKKIN